MVCLAKFALSLHLLGISNALSSTYTLSEEYVGEEFLDLFGFEAIPDPTHGRVTYVGADTAMEEGMILAEGDRFVARPDSKTVLSQYGPGRKSFRLKSKHQYGARTVMVFDIRHMPEGCGTWPAVWTVGMPWPQMGEIDILEGVNDQGPNHVTLHTSHKCDMPKSRLQTGTSTKESCGIGSFGTDYIGCPVRIHDRRSYGPEFNREGGGWYAMERTEGFIKVWFWSRKAHDLPSDVRDSEYRIDTSHWGTPVAYFPANRNCDIPSKFGQHWIIVNLTFCGDWAGNIYSKSGCPSTCDDFVNKNPAAFMNAYFDFHSLRIYKHPRRSQPHHNRQTVLA
ncbi:endo-beta-glucanase [Coprinellus micaceus]|uniref:Endo-beta-glucanase n=1 Tax=Coprinellus micaceus TaxID=71717 RepID=A0A4Y7TKZ9_COPMI|nr:endo-beta-glucanase [Coprinellus micaceus]